MPAPTIYTEKTLADFMHEVLDEVAVLLGWAAPADDALGKYKEPVNEAVLAYFGGAGDLADATDVRRLRAVARVEVWRAVADKTSGDYDYENATDKFKRSQINAQAIKAMARAQTVLDTLLLAATEPEEAPQSASLDTEVRW